MFAAVITILKDSKFKYFNSANKCYIFHIGLLILEHLVKNNLSAINIQHLFTFNLEYLLSSSVLNYDIYHLVLYSVLKRLN